MLRLLLAVGLALGVSLSASVTPSFADADTGFVSVQCTAPSPNPQACVEGVTVRFFPRVRAPQMFRVDLYAPTTHCSQVMYEVRTSKNGAPLGRTMALGLGSGHTGPFDGFADAIVVRGHPTLRSIFVTAMGLPGGCNNGFLKSWGVRVHVGAACDNEEGFICDPNSPSYVPF